MPVLVMCLLPREDSKALPMTQPDKVTSPYTLWSIYCMQGASGHWAPRPKRALFLRLGSSTAV